MKKLNYFLIVSVLLGFILTTSCKKDKDDEPKINESELAVDYLEQDLKFNLGSFVVGAEAVYQQILADASKQYIIDIRSQEVYNTGHIQGAVLVALPNLLEHMKTVNVDQYDRIVIACFTGQTSAYAVSLIRAAGFGNKVVSLKWGMSSWNSAFSSRWTDNLKNDKAAFFINDASPAKPAKGDLPVLNTGKKTGKEIVDAQIEVLLAATYGPATITNANLYADLNAYQIINYWPTSLYTNLGHIEGAINYPPAPTANDPNPFLKDQDLLTLSTTKPNVLYCYTGQTSSYLAGYLRLIGYDARSILYGGNGMIYDVMVANSTPNTFIPATEVKDYPFVTP